VGSGRSHVVFRSIFGTVVLGLKNIVVSGNMEKNRVGRSVFFTMVLISTLSYCTRFCLYFDMFCYRKNDLDMMIKISAQISP